MAVASSDPAIDSMLALVSSSSEEVPRCEAGPQETNSSSSDESENGISQIMMDAFMFLKGNGKGSKCKGNCNHNDKGRGKQSEGKGPSLAAVA